MSDQPKPVKIDITSSVVEKGIDLARGFLGKLMSPAVEEVGLFIKESVASWRFSNQVKILNKARKVCEENNISPKAISLKLLVPLLENASLEEDEYLQDKWANLLSNLVDSEQNIENHVFPFLLSQISKNEFVILENAYEIELTRVKNISQKLEQHLIAKLQTEKEIAGQHTKLEGKKGFQEMIDKNKLERELHRLSEKEKGLRKELLIPEFIQNNLIKDFEIINLTRLGILKVVNHHYAYADKPRIRGSLEYELEIEELDINIEDDGEDYRLSELGILFLKACTEKNNSEV